MNDDLDRFFHSNEAPDAALIDKIKAKIADSAALVRPLPSNAVLWAIGLTIFAALAVLIASTVKFLGVAALSGGEIAVYYGSIAVLAGLFARSVIERMIPGERRLVSASVLWILAFAVLAILLFGMFPDRNMEKFVELGRPCLRLGTISAFGAGLIGWPLLRRGYLVSPAETLSLYGFFAGLCGIAVLALHCPIRNFMHCLVWHLGAMVIAGLVGLTIGGYIENRSHGD